MEHCPLGYSRLAAFLDSDDNFMIYRRFGFLHARILLQKQDELRELEEAIDTIDKEDASLDRGTDKTRKCLKSRIKEERREDTQMRQTRKELLRSAEDKVREYGDYQISAAVFFMF